MDQSDNIRKGVGEKMKVTVRKIDTLKMEMDFEIPKERVTQKMDEVYKNLSKVSKVRGFRPGKVPREVLEREHSAVAKEETIKELIPEIYRAGIEQEKLSPIDMPEIKDVNFKDGMIFFTAAIEVKPEIKIKNYKEIQVKRKSSQVTDEEVNKTLEYFKKSQGKEDDVAMDDSFARGLGYPNLTEFKKSLTRQMEIDKDRQNRADVENQIISFLIKESNFTVPTSLVNKQMDYRIAETKKTLQSQKYTEEQIEKKVEELKKNLKSNVERDVQVYLIFDRIAELENIKVIEGENLINKVMEFLLKEASWQGNE